MTQIQEYSFRIVEPSDFPSINLWLETPEVSRWYDDPDYVEDIRDHITDERIRPQLVLYRNQPIAYVQDYDIHAYTEHPLSYLPMNSRGIDTFIGLASNLYKGHGTAYLSALAERLFRQGVLLLQSLS